MRHGVAFRVLVAALLLAAAPARAQLFDKSKFFGSGLGSETLQGAAPYGNPIADNRVYVHGFFDQLEGHIGDGSYFPLGRPGLDRHRS